MTPLINLQCLGRTLRHAGASPISPHHVLLLHELRILIQRFVAHVWGVLVEIELCSRLDIGVGGNITVLINYEESLRI